jgi:hypothetical protein
MRYHQAIVLFALTTGSSAGLLAQAASQPPATMESSVRATWRALHNKILAMAKDTVFPESKLDTKPHQDSRTVLDEYRHVTIGLEMSTAQLEGKAFDYAARLNADNAKPRTRASVVAEMESAIAASYAALEKTVAPSLIFWIDHQAEHYGKLVSNFRLSGIVPPVSRPRQRVQGS